MRTGSCTLSRVRLAFWICVNLGFFTCRRRGAPTSPGGKVEQAHPRRSYTPATKQPHGYSLRTPGLWTDSAWRVSHSTSLTVTLRRPWGAQAPLGEHNATLLEALLFQGCVTPLQFLSLSELHFLHLQSRVSDTVVTSVQPASVWSLNSSSSPRGAGGCWWLPVAAGLVPASSQEAESWLFQLEPVGEDGSSVLLRAC